MSLHHKSLLVRADFVLANRSGGGRLSCKRWRRLLADTLPGLMGCARRCPRAVIRLHEGGQEASYTGWLRIPIERRPGRKRLRKLKAKLRARLEAGLLPVDGRVLKVGVRREVSPAEALSLAMPSDQGSPPRLELFDPLTSMQSEGTTNSSLLRPGGRNDVLELANMGPEAPGVGSPS